MSSTRMAIVVRRDLNMPAGLLAAQVLHVGMGFVKEHVKFDLVPHALETLAKKTPYKDFEAIALRKREVEWIKQPYVAVLAVDTPEELDVVQRMAEDEKLPVNVWEDVIPSKVLEGRVLECVVGIAIGPADSDAIRKATGTLPLY